MLMLSWEKAFSENRKDAPNFERQILMRQILMRQILMRQILSDWNFRFKKIFYRPLE
jgi:hypothetical protein